MKKKSVRLPPPPPGRNKRSFPKRRAEETKLEVAHEDALAIEDCNHGDIDDKDLAGLPFDGVEDRVSRLHLKSASNTHTVVGDNRSVGKESSTVPGVEEGDDKGEIKPNVKPETRKPRGKNTMCTPPATVNPGEPQVKLDQFLRKCFQGSLKLSNQVCQNLAEIHSSTRGLKQHLKWKLTKRRFMTLQRSVNLC